MGHMTATPEGPAMGGSDLMTRFLSQAIHGTGSNILIQYITLGIIGVGG